MFKSVGGKEDGDKVEWKYMKKLKQKPYERKNKRLLKTEKESH